LLTGGKPFFIPAYTQQCDYETELVVRINHLGRSIPERFAHRYYDEVSVGIDFTARDMQKSLREKGLPWDLCKGFDGSAVVGDWIPVEMLGDVQNLHFHLDINGTTVQSGFTGDMIHRVDKLVSFISQFFTLKTGDIIFTGTPAGVGPVHIDDHLEGYLEGKKVLEFNVK
jgi:2-keto-4-pentenoate hydratase/2-oxohepta-3-ene-1,7-dioic acid hydratase in catechol pathway